VDDFRRLPDKKDPAMILPSAMDGLRFDEDARALLAEAARRFELLESTCASALLADDHASLALAAATAVICSTRARALVSAALHVEMAA